jgi:hypothetical protein
MDNSRQGRRASQLAAVATVALALLQSGPARADFRSVLVEHVRDHIGKEIGEALQHYFRQNPSPDALHGVSAQIAQCVAEAIRLDQQQDRLTAETDEIAAVPIGSPRFGEITQRNAQDQHEFDQAASEHRLRCQ